MSSINKDTLKELIKEALREVLIQPDIIKTIVSEAVKTSILTVLAEARVVPDNQVIQNSSGNNKTKPVLRTDIKRMNSDFQNSLKNEFKDLGNEFNIRESQFEEDDTKKILSEKYGKNISLEKISQGDDELDEDPSMLRLLGLK